MCCVAGAAALGHAEGPHRDAQERDAGEDQGELPPRLRDTRPPHGGAGWTEQSGLPKICLEPRRCHLITIV